jgi:hypothetical protein
MAPRSGPLRPNWSESLPAMGIMAVEAMQVSAHVRQGGIHDRLIERGEKERHHQANEYRSQHATASRGGMAFHHGHRLH